MLPDDLEERLQAYRSSREADVSVSEVIQSALEGYLRRQELGIQVKPPKQPLSITPAESGGGASDVSIHHDKYFVEAERDLSSR